MCPSGGESLRHLTHAMSIEKTAADYVHQGPGGRWYVCSRRGGQYYTPAKSPQIKGQYSGSTPDVCGYHYARRSDALRRAREVYSL